MYLLKYIHVFIYLLVVWDDIQMHFFGSEINVQMCLCSYSSSPSFRGVFRRVFNVDFVVFLWIQVHFHCFRWSLHVLHKMLCFTGLSDKGHGAGPPTSALGLHTTAKRLRRGRWADLESRELMCCICSSANISHWWLLQRTVQNTTETLTTASQTI